MSSNLEINHQRNILIGDARIYVTEKIKEAYNSGYYVDHSIKDTEHGKSIWLLLLNRKTKELIKESVANCSKHHAYNSDIGGAIALSKLLDDEESYLKFSNAPQPVIAYNQKATLTLDLPNNRKPLAVFVEEDEDPNYLWLDGHKISKETKPEGTYRILDDSLAIYQNL